ncbi:MULTISPECIES: DUF4389 domain-containing protein [unclassified Kitasatospora]|uniref:DUF4389 domain-containing protein n=1 Tax=unclassified Kitasatospora TaxID=2633591 RepID=UPI0038110699
MEPLELHVGQFCREHHRGTGGCPGTLSEASIAQGLAYGGWRTASIVVWLVVLALGRMPQPLYEATAAVLRYRMRHTIYLTMLSSAYPERLFGEEPGSEPEGPASGTRPLVLVGAGRGLLVLFLLLGLASWATGSVAASVNSDDDGNDEFVNPTQRVVAPLVPGPADRVPRGPPATAPPRDGPPWGAGHRGTASCDRPVVQLMWSVVMVP